MTRLISAEPYFDNFDPDANYTQVAFRAGKRPVQAREMNELQSILKGQTTSFANHVFKNGSKVSGATVSINKAQYIRLQTSITSQSYKIVSASGVEAIITKIEQATVNEPQVIYLVYSKFSNTISQFVEGESVEVFDKFGNRLKKTTISIKQNENDFNVIGTGVIANVRAGTFYINGSFVNISDFSFVVMKYTTNETITFGLIAEEVVTTYEQDVNLLDNALGYSNDKAPGADRIKVNIYPVAIIDTSSNSDNFIKLAEFSNGTLTYLLEDTNYSSLMDTMAQRTYEESGNYSVNGFDVKVREHLKTANNQTGVFTEADGGDESKLVSIVNPGLAYVNGYRVKTIADTFVTHDKARDTILIENQVMTIPEHQYLRCLYAKSTGANKPGLPTSNNYANDTVILYDSIGNIIGSAIVIDVIPESGGPITLASPFKVFLHSMSFVAPFTIKEVAKLKSVSGSSVFEMNTIPTVNGVELSNPTLNGLLFDSGLGYVKSFMPSGQAIIDISWFKQYTGLVDSSGNVSFNADTGTVFIPSGRSYAVAFSNTANGNPIVRESVNENDAGPLSVVIDLSSTASLRAIGKEGKYATLSLRVYAANVRPAVKTVHTSTTTITTVPNQLSYTIFTADVFRITKVETYTGTGTKTDVTQYFTFISGQKKNTVGLSQIMLNNQSISIGSSLDVTYDYFENDAGTSPAFFTVDSYNAEIDNQDKDFSYTDIPSFYEDGIKYSLANCFDFRPIKLASGYKPAIPVSINYSVQFNATVYAKRIDSVTLNKDGVISVVRGDPRLSPITPRIPQNVLKLADIYFNEYGFDLTSGVTAKKNITKRYTMDDIRSFDQRLKQVEYYTALSLLEQKTLSMDIRDEAGNNRYKNGFMVDSFDKFQSADISNAEYKASNDESNKELKPSFTMKSIPMIVNSTLSSINKSSIKSMFIPDYDDDVVMEQKLASTSISINPAYVFAKQGNLVLSPNIDTWADTDRQPNVSLNFNGITDSLNQIAQSAGLMNTNWGAWQEVNRTVQTNITDFGARRSVWTNNRNANGDWWGTWEQTGPTRFSKIDTIATSTQQRSGSFITIDDRVETHSIDAVTGISLEPFMRSNIVSIIASGMTPGSKLNAFFDKENVTQFCSPFGRNPGSDMIVSADGTFVGMFYIPSGKFYAGDKTLTITPANSLDNLDDFSSYASAVYYSAGVKQQKTNTTFNISSPVVNQHTVIEGRTTTSVSSITVQNWRPSSDPIAQSFNVDTDSYITGVDLYFSNKDTNNIWVELREMSSGFPVAESIAHVDVNINSVNTSHDATVATRINFIHPVKINANEYYAIVIGGASPETRLWVSQLGKPDVSTGKTIDDNSAIGVMFKSQNGTSWSIEQKDDIKMKIYRAKFKSQITNVTFDIIQNDKNFTNIGTSIETEAGSNKIRIACKSHGLVKNDYVKIYQYGYVTISSDSVPTIGQTITTPTGSFIVNSVDTNVDGNYLIKADFMSGYVLPNQAFTAQQYVIPYGDKSLVNIIANTTDSGITLPAFTGLIITYEQSSTTINGVSASLLFANDLQVFEVDTLHSFIVQIGQNANATGTVNKEMSVVTNIDYDVINWSLNQDVTSIDSSYKIEMVEKTSYANIPQKAIYPSADMMLQKTGIITSSANIGKTVGNSLRIVATYVSPSVYVAPIINLNSISMVAISYNVSNYTENQLNIQPNAANRFIDETKNNGSSEFKYISKTMQLLNTGYDIMVMLDVYKPLGSDFDIYYKTKNSYDSVSIDSSDWVKMNNIPKNFVSSNMVDRRECAFTLSDIDESFNSDIGFDYLKIKIVGKTTNKSNPPMFYNLRVLAIT